MSASTLPIELVELILNDFWARPLSTHDRGTFMKSSLAVSKTWARVYMRIFCEDVHIPSGGFALKFLEILRNESPVYSYHTQGSILLNRYCRSISFQRDNDAVLEASTLTPCSSNSDPSTPEHPMGLAIFAVLRALYFTPYFLPNLRRISILYHNALMSDLFARNKFMGFPPQVTNLEVNFAYDPRTSKEVLEAITSDEKVIGLVPGTMANVRSLHLLGLTHAAVEELLLACPNWEQLEMEAWRCSDKNEEDGIQEPQPTMEVEDDGTNDHETLLATAPSVQIFTLRQHSGSQMQRYVAYFIFSCSFLLLALFGAIALML